MRDACAQHLRDVAARDAPVHGASHGQSRDHVLQLAHVAGPGVAAKSAASASAPSTARLPGICQRLAPERRARAAARPRPDRAAAGTRMPHDRQPEPQVVTEAARAAASARGRLVAATTRTSIGAGAVLAEPPNLALLQHAQQLGLRPRRELADLVEEQGAAVRLLEQPGTRPNRAGERAARVAEQLGLDELVGEGGAVDRGECGGRGAD